MDVAKYFKTFAEIKMEEARKTEGSNQFVVDTTMPIHITQWTKKNRKKFYHNFTLADGRIITLCLLVIEIKTHSLTYGTHYLNVGYSVCLPKDTYDHGLGKKIALGRAEKEKTLGQETLPKHLILNNGVLHAIARVYENKLEKGELTINGIR